MPSLALLDFTGGDGLVIFLVLLLLFGAKRLRELAKGLVSAVREFSKAKDEIEKDLTGRASHSDTHTEEAEGRSWLLSLWRALVRQAVFPSILP